MKRLLISILSLVLLAGCAPAAPAEPEPPVDPIDALMASMTLEEQVGQLFFARCPGTDAAQDAADYHLGGYILFKRDVADKSADQVRADIRSYQEASSIPMIIGVDEEGGTVVRVSSNPQLRSEKFSSPQKLFRKGGMDAILAETEEKDKLLLDLGFNVNMAPVADVCTDPEAFIYDRTFGHDGVATANYVEQVVSQMNWDGMGSVLKHFPGYGHNVDTHVGMAVDDRSLEEFRTSDFLPFLSGLEGANGSAAVLVSHNIISAVDPDLPASLSPAVHDLLREELNFDGVVMTDDLAMEGANLQGRSAAVLAIQAGNDFILTSSHRRDIRDVLAALEAGTLNRATVEDSCRRVLVWKQALGLLDLPENS